MKERIENLRGIELGLGPRGEYYLFFTSTRLNQTAMIALQASNEHHSDRKVLDAWIEEQRDSQKRNNA
jgi:hypothetical protein